MHLPLKTFPVGDVAQLDHDPGMVAAAHQNQVHLHRRFPAGGIAHGDFLGRHLALARADLFQQHPHLVMVNRFDHVENTASDDLLLRVAQRLLFPFVDGHNHAVLPHHKHRIRHQVEQCLIPFLRGHQLPGALVDRLFQSGRVLMDLRLQQPPLRDIADKRARVNQTATAFE